MKHECEEVSRLVSDGFERELSFTERLRKRLHLLICSACHRYDKSLRKIHAVLRLDAEGYSHARLSPAHRERIRKALEVQKG